MIKIFKSLERWKAGPVFCRSEEGLQQNSKNGGGVVTTKKAVSKVIVKVMMSLYEGETTKVRVGSVMFEKSSMNVRVH